ncbi:uncharacterized protein Z518_08562 [Rhinocladiella mackenziei CBS 650.93]|uniref:Uncharacterized protein n=1 Tax=Rhinocladiella mackenziei CBS 650.93 TaxID=1442369 RepID=A0A0D2J171_9EURO|nr:uncharacterized protein Z518_08562 [Rhinocladiella mackenziei CBS 650.93]KIX02620.1 hypothetical protein Z518_08562 [Rhinocladiella mackenziei CBS 650.93]
MQMRSPPPSQALLDLQKQGLELAVSGPPNNLQVTAGHVSTRSTPSDRDKPLPLEPSERKRRSSSVYSSDTTISNIIRMYGGHRELDELPPVAILHQPQAYRDTVAPLLIKCLSLSHSRSAAFQTSPMPMENKITSSFVEFSRARCDQTHEPVSPLSTSSTNHHRQAAYDQLAPPSPQVSSIELSISLSPTPPLPDALSGTISDVEGFDLLPSPLGFSRSSPPSPVFDEWNEPSKFHYSNHHQHPQGHIQQYASGQAWSDHWLEDSFVRHSPVSEAAKLEGRNSQPSTSLSEKEQEHVTSYADTQPTQANDEASALKTSQNSRARSSLQQGVTNFLRTLSISNRTGRNQQSAPSREKQPSIPATSYQVHDAEIFSEKHNKTQQEGQRVPPQGRKSLDFFMAYQSGQSQLVGVIEGVKRKLTRKISQKRRRKLKQSIIVVGLSETTSAMDAMKRFPADDEDSWI